MKLQRTANLVDFPAGNKRTLTRFGSRTGCAGVEVDNGGESDCQDGKQPVDQDHHHSGQDRLKSRAGHYRIFTG